MSPGLHGLQSNRRGQTAAASPALAASRQARVGVRPRRRVRGTQRPGTRQAVARLPRPDVRGCGRRGPVRVRERGAAVGDC